MQFYTVCARNIRSPHSNLSRRATTPQAPESSDPPANQMQYWT
jgi:hypothetical protein